MQRKMNAFLAKLFRGAHDLPALTALFQAAGFTLVDIGGRRAPVRDLRMLSPFSHYVTCEPDQEEADRLAEGSSTWRKLTVVGEAIAANAGEAVLYITRKPGMSSLLEPDPAVAQQFCIAGTFNVERTVTVPTLPLDTAAIKYGFADACFLKLDTQGTELEILRSGLTLLPSVECVKIETCFYPFYRGQSLFADVDPFLRERGFVLLSLQRTNLRHADYRPSVYSRRITVWAHCLYFRRDNRTLDEATFAHRLGLALAFQYFDLAFALAEQQRNKLVLAEIERCAAMATKQALRDTDDESALLGSSLRDHLQPYEP
jgi:FkbM family methyltransferase